VHQEAEDLSIRPRAFQADAVAGVVAGIAMSLNARVTSLLVLAAVTLRMR
jgi:phage shock protein PspC (stress-responsive transcriptional regulator)